MAKPEKRIAYIAGPITGVANYWEPFQKLENQLRREGWIALNPTVLPGGMAYEAYMPICLAMVEAADTLFALPGAEKSCGALAEIAFARAMNKKIVYL